MWNESSSSDGAAASLGEVVDGNSTTKTILGMDTIADILFEAWEKNELPSSCSTITSTSEAAVAARPVTRSNSKYHFNMEETKGDDNGHHHNHHHYNNKEHNNNHDMKSLLDTTTFQFNQEEIIFLDMEHHQRQLKEQQQQQQSQSQQKVIVPIIKEDEEENDDDLVLWNTKNAAVTTTTTSIIRPTTMRKVIEEEKEEEDEKEGKTKYTTTSVKQDEEEDDGDEEECGKTKTASPSLPSRFVSSPLVSSSSSSFASTSTSTSSVMTMNNEDAHSSSTTTSSSNITNHPTDYDAVINHHHWWHKPGQKEWMKLRGRRRRITQDSAEQLRHTFESTTLSDTTTTTSTTPRLLWRVKNETTGVVYYRPATLEEICINVHSKRSSKKQPKKDFSSSGTSNTMTPVLPVSSRRRAIKRSNIFCRDKNEAMELEKEDPSSMGDPCNTLLQAAELTSSLKGESKKKKPKMTKATTTKSSQKLPPDSNPSNHPKNLPVRPPTSFLTITPLSSLRTSGRNHQQQEEKEEEEEEKEQDDPSLSTTTGTTTTAMSSSSKSLVVLVLRDEITMYVTMWNCLKHGGKVLDLEQYEFYNTIEAIIEYVPYIDSYPKTNVGKEGYWGIIQTIGTMVSCQAAATATAAAVSVATATADASGTTTCPTTTTTTTNLKPKKPLRAILSMYLAMLDALKLGMDIDKNEEDEFRLTFKAFQMVPYLDDVPKTDVGNQGLEGILMTAEVMWDQLCGRRRPRRRDKPLFETRRHHRPDQGREEEEDDDDIDSNLGDDRQQNHSRSSPPSSSKKCSNQKSGRKEESSSSSSHAEQDVAEIRYLLDDDDNVGGSGGDDGLGTTTQPPTEMVGLAEAYQVVTHQKDDGDDDVPMGGEAPVQINDKDDSTLHQDDNDVVTAHLCGRSRLLTMGALVMAVSLTMSILLPQKLKDNDKSSSSSSSSSLRWGGGAPTMSPTVYFDAMPHPPAMVTPNTQASAAAPTTMRFSAMFDLFGNISSTDILSDPTLPQYRALDWISNNDPQQQLSSPFYETSWNEQAQRYSLATLYFATSGSEGKWWNDQDWLSEKSACEWTGVSCDTWNRVIELNLGSNGLSGILTAEIGLLASLQKLDLVDNNLVGSLPSELGSLSSLLEVLVGLNSLSGYLPSTLATMDSLELLDIRFTEIVDTHVLQAFCNKTTLQTEIWADCARPFAEVDCPCCTQCCSDEHCFHNVPEVCEIDRSRFEVNKGNYFDASRETSCECKDEGHLLSCSDHSCPSCNSDGTICALNTDYGYRFNNEGIPIGWTSNFQYTVGRRDLVALEHSYENKEECRVTVNGQPCSSCSLVTCLDGVKGYDVVCDNLIDVGNVSMCSGDMEGGALTVFELLDASSRSGCSPRFDPMVMDVI